MNKYDCLKQTVEITKEYARSGGTSVHLVMQNVYEMLKKLAEDAKEE